MNLSNRDSYQSIYIGNKIVKGARSDKRLSMIDWSIFEKMTVLDIGCNNGMLALEAARHGAIVFAVDKSKAALCVQEISRSEGLNNIEVIRADIEEEGFLDQFDFRFNIIFFCAMLNHIKDKIKVLNWIDLHCNGYFFYETNFENKPEKCLSFVEDYTSFCNPTYLGASGDRKKEDYNLYRYSRPMVELFGPYDHIPVEEVKIKDLRISVDDVDKFKGEQYKCERAKVDKLKRNIRQNGLIEPLWLHKKKTGLYIKEGGHRYLACKELGWKNIESRIIQDDTK